MELNGVNKDRKARRKQPTDITTMVYGKVPPQAKEIEEAVLGAIMLEAGALDIVNEILQPECFYVDSHQRIFKAIQALQKRGRPVDILTVVEELKTSDELEMVGGPYFVTKLTNSVVSAANIETHCRIVQEKYVAREVIRLAGEMISNAYEDSADIFEVLNEAEININQLSNTTSRASYVQLDTALVREVTRLEADRLNPEILTGVPTGFVKLDELTSGWQKTDLILLAARPSCGKTALAINLALNAARHPTKPTAVGIFSVEMSLSKITQRIMAAVSGMPLESIKRAHLTDNDMTRLYSTGVQPIAGLKLWVDDTAALTIPELRAKARKMKLKQGVGLIVIDYLQLLKTGEKGKPPLREQEVAAISSAVKALAKNLKIPIIALSQLSRDIEKRADGKFKLSDLRESGSLEQDADIVAFIHKPTDEEIKNEAALRNTASVIIAKNRDGELGDVVLNFYGVNQRWRDLEPGTTQHQAYRPAPTDYTVPNRSRLNSDDEENPF